MTNDLTTIKLAGSLSLETLVHRSSSSSSGVKTSTGTVDYALKSITASASTTCLEANTLRPKTLQLDRDASQTNTPSPDHADVALESASLQELALPLISSHARTETTKPAYSSTRATTLVSRTTADVIADLKRPIGSFNQSSRHQQGSTSNSMTKSTELLVEARSVPNMNASSTPGNEAEDEYGQGSGADSEAEQSIETVKPKKISERRRRQQAIADAHIQKAAQETENQASCVKPGEEDQQSTKWIIKQSESKQIISSPRDYQVELFERAKEKNIIAVLDTGMLLQTREETLVTGLGSGKTLIACLLLRHIIDQELENRALGKPRRISFFLVRLSAVLLVFLIMAPG